MTSAASWWMLSQASSVNPSRPPMQRQPSLLPFDGDDGGNQIHTTLPPEQIIPTKPDRDWWIGDAWGVTLTETPPLVPGCNTTPREMVMSYLLPRYPRVWQDKILTAHAERGYTHFLLDRATWQSAGYSDADAVDLFAYVQSWGFFTSYWATGSSDPRDQNWDGIKPLIAPFLRALIAAGLAEKSICILGEELNSWNRPGPSGLDDIIDGAANICDLNNIPLWLHFTSNVPGWPGKPGESVEDWWSEMAGGVRGCCWQSNAADSAALQSAHLWDTRWRVAVGDPQLKVCAFELKGNEQLYGRCDETCGSRTAWELVCATRGPQAPNAPAVAGSMNGPRFGKGNPLLMGEQP
jgi:hypothetical protein